jgi:hypothetical protein
MICPRNTLELILNLESEAFVVADHDYGLQENMAVSGNQNALV